MPDIPLDFDYVSVRYISIQSVVSMFYVLLKKYRKEQILNTQNFVVEICK